MLLNIIVAILISVGIYLVFANIFEVATIKSVRSILMLNKSKEMKKHVFLYSLSKNFMGIVKLEPYTKEKVERALKTQGDSTSAEMYYAMTITRFGMLTLLGLFFFLLSPAIGLLIIVLGIIQLFTHIQKPDKLIKENRETIERDLPRFVAIIKQELKNGHSVFEIIEYYQPYADNALGEELKTTLANMRAGDSERALLKLESRVGSNQLSEVVRGLIRGLIGDDPIGYFEMISNDFRALEISALRKDSLKRPQKINKFSFLILVMVVATILVVLGIYTFKLVPNIF